MFKSVVVKIGLAILVVCLPLAVGAVESLGAANVVPDGYVGSVVLHVDYGESPDKAPVNWGNSGERDEREFLSPSSMFGLKVLGDRFYFIADGVKVYRSPGTFLWMTGGMPNAQFLAVSPDGRAYIIWGNAMESLTCIDPNGKVLWTKSYEDVIGFIKREDIKKQHDIGSIIPGMFGLSWTDQGLAVELWTSGGSGNDGLVVLVDQEGKFSRVAVGKALTKEGQPICYRSERAQTASAKSATLKNTRMESLSPGKQGHMTIVLPAHDLVHTKEGVIITRLSPGPRAGFVASGQGVLKQKVRLNKRDVVELDCVLWVFDDQGNQVEEWRFPQSRFDRVFQPSYDWDSAGNVYHVNYGDSGLHVIKYSRQKAQ